ncbi:MAG: 3'(2'),5'-bisphosphate nucleotidase CysQ [Gammaproteobacteria bacterium]
MTIELDSVKTIAEAAGREILSVYHDSRPVDVTIKDDDSPLTLADRKANDLIVSQLNQLDASIPVLSEESEQASYETRQTWQRYWLVDPLDGTKEFINRNGEFTVNIALIEAGEPVLGVVHVPVTGATYYGGSQVQNAWKSEPGADPQTLAIARINETTDTLRIVASRSHRDSRIDQLIQLAQTRFEFAEELSMGSSLKLCLVAEGKADFYPRLAPTSEWDTAAAHAIVRAAGGDVLTTNFEPLRYNQSESLLNPFFLVIGDLQFQWQSLLASALD